jgi:hypothetical protein
MSVEPIRTGQGPAPRAPAPVRASSLDRAAHRSFLADVVVEHGPRDVLARMFLKADTALREKGIFVSFTDFDELRHANRQNSDTWRPLLPIFDPEASRLPAEDALAIIGRDASGRVVFAQSSRIYRLGETTLKDEIESLRIFYKDPAQLAEPGEAMHASAPVAADRTGNVAFNGGLWLHPDFRGLDATNETVQISRGLLFTRWNPGFLFSFMVPDLVRKGFARRARQHVDWEVTMINTPIKRGDTIHAALVWTDAVEQCVQFADYLAGSTSARGDTQVDGIVVEASSNGKRA